MVESRLGCLWGAGTSGALGALLGCISRSPPQGWGLTCRFGTLCTEGTASPSACEVSARCPGRPRGSAARSWCRTPGPAGCPARCTPSTARPLSATREGGQGCLLVRFYPARTLGRAGGCQHPGVVSPSPTYPCPRPQPRARGRAAAGSSWTGSSRWRRHRGSGRGGSSRRPPGTGWWPPPARSIHISGGTGRPGGVSAAAGEPNRAPVIHPNPSGCAHL